MGYTSPDAFRYVLKQYRQNAKRKKVPFELNDTIFVKLISSDCSYCGQSPATAIPACVHAGKHHAAFRYNGIDRIDSSKGYTEDNVIPCCPLCNQIKSNLSQDTFLALIEKVHAHQNRWMTMGGS